MAKRTKKLIDNNTTDDSIRLNKYLSDAGLCSRREADQYIASGEVMVDGEIAETGTKVTPGQKVVFRGKPVNQNEKLILIAFNKPRGIVCTTDRREKDNIIDYINYGQRIYPIGRLDKDSEGIILLTNDGNIVNKILRAGNNHEKEYIVEINKPITSQFLKGMAEGVPILDTVTLPCEIQALGKTTFQIILTQGLNRQIRRMCEYYGYKVLSLKRVRIMNINLGYLQVGGYRNVTDKELAGLKELISESVNTPQAISGVNDEETPNIRSISKNVSTSRNLSTSRNASNSRTSYAKTNAKNKAFSKNTYSKKTSDLEKTDSGKPSYGKRAARTEKSDDTRKSDSGRSSYGKRYERTEKPEYDTRKSDSGKPSYGKRYERTEKPDYDTRKSDSGKPSYGKRFEKTEKPGYDTRKSDSGKPSYGKKYEKTEKPGYDTRKSDSGKPSYGKRYERTEKPEYDTRKSDSGRSSYGKRYERTEKPEYDTRKSDSGKPSYGKRYDRTEKPEYDNRKSDSGKSSYGKRAERAERTERTEKPDYNTRKSDSGKSSYGKRYDRNEKPDYETRKSDSGKSTYGKRFEKTEKSDYETRKASSGKSSFGKKSDDSSKSFKSFTNTKSSNHSRNIDFNKPSDNRRNNGRQANTSQRAGRKTK